MRPLWSVANVLGRLLLVFSLTYLVPIASAIYFRDGTLVPFVVSLMACVAFGLVLERATRRYRAELKARDGFILVVLAWTLTAAIASVPLMLHEPGSMDEPLSFTDAFFETMSGLTTTGATVLLDIEVVPRALEIFSL